MVTNQSPSWTWDMMVFIISILNFPFVEGKLKRRRSRMGLRPPSPFRLKNPRSMSDCSISSIAPFCRREESYSCRTEALQALFTTVSWTRRGGGDIPQTEMCSRTESWAAAPSATKESPLASLSGLMECEVLDWQVASTGSERCRGESTVSPHTRPAGGEGRTVAGERQRVPQLPDRE